MNALETIAAGAAEMDLAFLLAGGHAVIAHGHPRTTFDVDLIICREDRAQWLTLARNMGYISFSEGSTFLQFDPPNPKVLPLDLMLVAPDTFGKMMAEAVPAPASLSTAKIVSLRHLLALKCHAIKHGHAGRVEKDVDDVICLLRVNAIDINSSDIRSLFLKHGPKELYEKIQRIWGRT
jgi:hypothetical protein